MYYLYMLKSENQERYYVGITGNIEKRLREHNTGKTKSTKGYRPWQLVYVQGYDSRAEARKMEIHLKKNHRAKKDTIDSLAAHNGPIVYRLGR